MLPGLIDNIGSCLEVATSHAVIYHWPRGHLIDSAILTSSHNSSHSQQSQLSNKWNNLFCQIRYYNVFRVFLSDYLTFSYVFVFRSYFVSSSALHFVYVNCKMWLNFYRKRTSKLLSTDVLLECINQHSFKKTIHMMWTTKPKIKQ